mgnify:CR=1 FL=1
MYKKILTVAAILIILAVFLVIFQKQPNNNNITPLNNIRLRRISETTIGHYDRLAEDFWQKTKNHDVSQNYEAFLEAIEKNGSNSFLLFKTFYSAVCS